MIYISHLSLHNYRRFKDADIPFKPHTVLIGENNAGKTSVLELLDIALNPTRRGLFLDSSDFTHGLDENKEKIEAVIEVRPWSAKIFGTEERLIFDPHIDILKDGSERLLLRMEYGFDEEEGAFRTRIRFIKVDGKDDGSATITVRRNISFFSIPALRSAARDLNNRAGTWGRIVAGVQFEEAKSTEIKTLAANAAQQIMQIALGDKAFADTNQRLVELLKTVLWTADGTGDLSYSAIPTGQRELLQAMQILIRNPGDAQSVSVLEHGDGTQSIAVVALMLAYVGTLGFTSSTLAVEEPESHLHPHATRSLVQHLWSRPQQVIISTHSTHVTDVVNPDQIVALKRRGASTVARFIPDGYFKPQELMELTRHIRTVGSEFFFAKCAFLVEGATETIALRVFANALKIDLDRLGISLVGVGGSNFGPFIKLFQPQALDTPFLILCDNDKVAVSVANIFKSLGLTTATADARNIESMRASLEKLNLHFLPKGNFEEYVMESGNLDVYESAIGQVFGATMLDSYVNHRIASDQSYKTQPRAQQIAAFLERNGRKPEVAYEVANLLTTRGTDSSKIPPYFVTSLKAIEALAIAQMKV